MTAASALSHVNKAWELAASGALDRALAEAHAAAALAPRQVQTQQVLGEMLARSHQTQGARQAYQTALSLAETIYPDFQSFWVPYLRGRLARL
jgi:Flp pilus assembly protein TadD